MPEPSQYPTVRPTKRIAFGTFNVRQLFRLTLAKRLAYGFGLLGLGVVAIMIASLAGLTRINMGLDALVREAIPAKEQLAEARIALLQVSTSAAEHYNSREPALLDEVESAMAANVQQFNRQMDRLKANGSLVERSDALMEKLSQASSLAKDQIKLIEWNMNTHRRSLEREQRIENLRLELQDLRNRAQPVFENSINDIEHPPAQALAYKLQGLLESATLMAINVSLADSLEVIEGLQQQLRDNLDGVATMTFDILDQSDADVAFAEYYKNIEPLFEELNQLATANDGLISQQKNLFVEIRNILPGKIEAVQNRLAEAAQSFSELSGDVGNTVDGISTGAVNSVSVSRTLIVAATVATVILCFIVSWLVIRSIRKPIRRLSRYMKQVGTGDFTAKVGSYKQDEIGEIFASTEAMVENFKAIVIRISELSDDINSVSKSTAEATSSARATLNDQSHDLNSVATALTEMSASIREVAENTRNATDEMNQSEERAHEIEHSIKASVRSSNNLNEAMQEASEVIGGLDEEVSSIEQILEVIQGIAEQTNLLALNAAIEAARAGEQGKGFAVVADEVRTLASRTQQSTQEIRSKINRVMTGSQSAVDSIGKSRENVEEVSDRVHHIHETFEEYLHSVAKLAELNIQVSASTEEQQATSQEMSERTNAINDQGIEVSSSFESTAERANQLNTIAIQLNEAISRIKL